ncbi:methylmalonyl Co-A mutase-associated GTPase MeaB [Alteribacter natronophilus]|uniref:methylmalonyl Co-A mutase-associated GTPase MeaB n=1 Tax=Alteribacter natronophilus TaxID=2583810 RepID=UPI00110D9F20|nr:methylmalonyl Co-A mutase-associated GTPase MeaB [Alteribacter natronophilus]TMW72137.1 methylmalonyl Co-A mutase-associated GTPase MeaB [Alteribacter natronophilus]
MEQLAERILKGELRALARGITHIENDHPEKQALLTTLFSRTGEAHVIGITGSPGAGKSSLVNGLIKVWRKEGKTVGVVAVDPTSPFSGGALLGDRVRMRDHEEDEGVFIRSMGTRGSLGGLSEACKDAIRLMDASGLDLVIVETVGVGQSELDIMKVADTVALVLYPSGGDVIQAFKAGIMEIADLFVINKADLPGVGQLKGEVEDLLHLTAEQKQWKPPIVETVSIEGKGMEETVRLLNSHYHHLSESGENREKKITQLETEITRRMKDSFAGEISSLVADELQRMAKAGETPDPYETAETLYEKWKRQLADSPGHGN